MILDFKLNTSAKLCLLLVVLSGPAWATGSDIDRKKSKNQPVLTPEKKQKDSQENQAQQSSVDNQKKPFELVIPPKLNLGLCDG